MNWQERVKQEHDDLKIKWEALTAFLGSEKFKDISPKQQELLVLQATHMEAYLGILALRLLADALD